MMKSKLSLFGVGLTGNYQFALMRHTFNVSTVFTGLPITGTPFGLFLLSLDTGFLMEADDMPVSIKPGYFKQGKHDLQGDTELSQAKLVGHVWPPVVSSTLGASLPIASQTRNTGFVVRNYTSSQTRVYPLNNPIPTPTALVQRWFTLDNVYYDGTGVLGTVTREKTSKGLHVVMHFQKGSTEMHFDVWVTGRYNYVKRLGSSGNAPDYTSGSYEVWYRLNGGTKQYLRSSTSSGLALDFYTPPTSLSNISTELALTSIGDGESSGLIRDLRSLATLEQGNSPWLACYYAVESMKAVRIATPESLRDSSHVMQMLPPFKAFAKLASPKSWAQIYLWLIYGVLPTIGDAKALSAAISSRWNLTMEEQAKEFAKAHTKYGTVYDRTQVLRNSQVTYKCNAKVQLRPRLQRSDKVAIFMTMLKLYNIEVNMANVWELIPYSFVVDWFVNTGRFAKFVDYTTYATQYDVTTINISHKRSVDLPADTYFPGATGQVSLVTYDREIHHQFPVEPFDLRFTSPNNHWLEGTALLVSKLK